VARPLLESGNVAVRGFSINSQNSHRTPDRTPKRERKVPSERASRFGQSRDAVCLLPIPMPLPNKSPSQILVANEGPD
jgi:hypothetical protein